MRKHVCFLLLLAVLLLPSCNGYKLDKRAARFEKEMAPFREKMENVGMSVVFVRQNQIVYVHHFGVKNVETQEPIDDLTMFRIASISKSFTATSLMQLVEKGVVSLDTVMPLCHRYKEVHKFRLDLFFLRHHYNHCKESQKREHRFDQVLKNLYHVHLHKILLDLIFLFDLVH